MSSGRGVGRKAARQFGAMAGQQGIQATRIEPDALSIALMQAESLMRVLGASKEPSAPPGRSL